MSLSTHTIPVNYANLLLNILEEHGGSTSDAIAASAIDRDVLLDEAGLLSYKQIFDLVDFIQEKYCIEDLGLRAGQKQTLSTWGRLGYAMMTSDNLDEVIALGARYQGTTANFLEIQHDFTPQTKQHVLLLCPRMTPSERLPFFVESTLAGIHSVLSSLVDSDAHHGYDRVEVTYKKPKYWKSYQEFFRCEIAFECKQIRAYYTQRENPPMKLADPANFSYLLKQLEERDQKIRSSDFIEILKQTIHHKEGRFLSQSQTAKKLNMSSSTLSRRLRDLSLTFQGLSDHLKRDIAIDRLVNTNEPLIAIAHASGYEDLSNFNKAFRRWTGLSPSQYRKSRTGN